MGVGNWHKLRREIPRTSGISVLGPHAAQILRLDIQACILLLQQLGANDLKRSRCSASPAAPRAGFWWSAASAAQRYWSLSVTAHTVTSLCMGGNPAQLRPRCVLRRTQLQVGRTRLPARQRPLVTCRPFISRLLPHQPCMCEPSCARKY